MIQEVSVKQFLPIVQNLVTHTNIKPATFGALPWGSSQLIRQHRYFYILIYQSEALSFI